MARDQRTCMKVFIAYGYTARDQWVEAQVFPIVKAFGFEVVHGGDLQGQPLPPAVIEQIDSSDGLIAFVTVREPGTPLTHRWVTDELAVAITKRKWAIEVREQGVSDQGGLATDRVLVPYDPGRRDETLVELVTAIGNQMRKQPKRLQLLPEGFVNAVRPKLRRAQCEYELMEGSRRSGPFDADILPIRGGLFIDSEFSSPETTLIRVRVRADGEVWESDFEQAVVPTLELRTG